MADNFTRKRDTGCFYIKNGTLEIEKIQDQKEKWLNKQVSLHFLLMFFIFWGALILLAPDFFSEKSTKKLGLASLDFPDINGKVELELASPVRNKVSNGVNGAKLPLADNKFYLLPLAEKIEIPELPPSEPKKPERAVARQPRASSSRAPQTIKFNEEELKNGKYIEVGLSEQILKIYGSGELKGIYKISTGKPNTPTPVGSFRVLRKSANAWSVRGGLWMPYALEFKTGYFIHELPYWPGGEREGVGHLGQQVSGGCIRLGIGPAKEVYDFADIGTPVIIRK